MRNKLTPVLHEATSWYCLTIVTRSWPGWHCDAEQSIASKNEGYMVALRPSTADAENREAHASTCTQRQWQIRKHQKDVIFMLTFFTPKL